MTHLRLTLEQAIQERKKTLSPALAIFVKTPGLSPVKTRLAEGIGKEGAEPFFRFSVGEMQALGKRSNQVARDRLLLGGRREGGAESHPQWENLPRIEQGEGDLGARLSRVYDEPLLKKHSSVILVGADSPEIDGKTIEHALSELEKSSFVLGPSF